MPLLYYAQNITIGIVLISTILYYVLGLGGKRQPLDSLFIYLLFSVLALLILKQCINYFNGRLFPGALLGNTISVFLFYFFLPWPGFLYFLYIDQLHNKWVVMPAKIGLIVAIPMHIQAILAMISLSNGMLFYIDSANLYHRGRYFVIVALLKGLYLVASMTYGLVIYGKENQRNIPLIILFPYPVVIGATIQFFFQYTEVYLVSLALTMLMVYLRLQNIHANRDYLTNLYNRSIGEAYLKHQQNKKKLVAGILMDIDGFKQVNDTYGHNYGDICLRHVAQLLSDSFSRNWLICRYGGDEFLLVRILHEKHEMDEDILHFIKNLEYFNIQEKLRFSLSVSMGKGIIDELDEADADAFLKLLDSRMYQNKAEHHALGQGALEPQTIGQEDPRPVFS